MCLGIPGRIVKITDGERNLAMVDGSGVQREVNVACVIEDDEDVQSCIGDLVLVHVGFAMSRIDEAEAAAFLCGPEIMMRFTAQALTDRGVDPERTFVSMERNMKCAIGFCGHCQLGPEFVCLDGPVFPWPRMRPLIDVREL